MPRIKSPQRSYGHAALLPAVASHLRKRGLSIPVELPAVALVACKPQILTREDCAPERGAFNRCFAEHPDEVIEALRFARAKIAETPESKAGVIRDFLTHHNALLKSRGKLKPIQPPARGDRIIMIADLTDGEIAQFLTAPGRNMDADSVRKERQRLSGNGNK